MDTSIGATAVFLRTALSAALRILPLAVSRRQQSQIRQATPTLLTMQLQSLCLFLSLLEPPVPHRFSPLTFQEYDGVSDLEASSSYLLAKGAYPY